MNDAKLAPMNWEDVRVFLAVARAGSVSRASRVLGLNPSTVTRRLASLEADLGVRLYDRLPAGYTLTAAGTQLQARAEELDSAMAAMARDLSAQDSELRGPVVVSVPVAAGTLLLRELGTFSDRYPDIEVSLVESDAQSDLDKRHADIVVRAVTQPLPPHWIGRKAGCSRQRVYASNEYLSAHPLPEEQLIIDGGQPGERHLPEWASHLEAAKVVLRASERDLQLQAACAGLGLAALPQAICDLEPALVRVTGFDPLQEFEIWVLTHPELRDVPKIRVLQDFLVGVFSQFA